MQIFQVPRRWRGQSGRQPPIERQLWECYGAALKRQTNDGIGPAAMKTLGMYPALSFFRSSERL
jgi:hypothetical protein